MYRVSNGMDNSIKIENRFHTENLVSDINQKWIESVPMFHYKPGTMVFNVGTIGCNFDCKFCINEHFSRISPDKIEGINLFVESPDHLVQRAIQRKLGAIVFGNNEPTVSLDYVIDLARACKRNSMPFGISTNGFMSTHSLNALLDEGIDFVNFDIKSFSPEYLREIIGIDNNHTQDAKRIFLRNLKEFVNSGSVQMVEVNTPVIHNKNTKEIIDIAKEIAKIDPQIPYHIQRVVPEYEIKNQNLDTGLIQDTIVNYKIILEILDYVYFGAFPNSPYVDTYCKKCGSVLIKRADSGGCQAELLINHMNTLFCPKCNTKIKLVL